MRDYGLLVSLLVAFGAPTLLARRRWRLTTVQPGTSLLDVAIGPAVVALLVGRAVTLLIDDERALLHVSDIMVLRSGVEFWPALAAGAVWASWSARREGYRVLGRLAEIAPLAMVGYGAFEIGCLWRDGCFGPKSQLGIHPVGVSIRMLPVGILAGGSLVVLPTVLRSIARRISAAEVLLIAIGSTAAVRALASIWLPHLGDGLTRQHRASVAVAFLALASLGFIELARAARRKSIRVAVDC